MSVIINGRVAGAARPETNQEIQLSTEAVEKPLLRCYVCSTPYHYRIPRNWFVRNILFFLPIKVFFCGRCVEHRYIWLTDKAQRKYQPV